MSKVSTANMARRLAEDLGTPLLDQAEGAASSSVLPVGRGAVMASRVATETGDLDYFPTPPWAARAGGELIRAIDPGDWTAWEPACGEGHLVHGLRDYFATVHASDVFDYGFGEVVDFLAPDRPPRGPQGPDWIVTNPPFKLGEAFVRRAYAEARRGVAMLLRLQFIEGGRRHALFAQDCPLTILAPFSERVPMVKGRWDPDASSATAYAWFIFRKGAAPGPAAVHLIPPGSKDRLSRPGDLIRFGMAETSALFGDAA